MKDNISYVDVSPDGKKMAFTSRGELFVSDVEGKFIRQISSASERVMEVKWLADNKTLLFNQTFDGYQNWFSVSADGKGEMKQLTHDQRNNRDVAINSDRTQAVYLSGRDEVRVLDLKTFQSSMIVKDEIWAFQNSAPSFSPDDKYVMFTAYRNFEQDIFVHHLATKATINLTNTGVSEASPVWDPNGKSIYFVSNRTRPAYPFGMQDASIYRMALDDYDEPYRVDKFDALFAADKDKNNAKANVTVENSNAVSVTINTTGLLDRITLVSPSFGTQSGISVFKKGDKTYIFYTSNHEGGRPSLYRTVVEPFERNKTEKVVDGRISNFLEVGGRYFAISSGAVQKYNIDNNKMEKVEIGHTFQRNLQEEFHQMFEETWAGLEENFYDSEFHGVDWSGAKRHYTQFLPYINSRSDLRVLLNDMLGELNSSHLGFASAGSEERVRLNYVTNETGIIFSDDNPYKVVRIAERSNAARVGVGVRPGNVLKTVDGVTVDPSKDRYFYFTKPSLSEEMELTFEREGKSVSVKIRPQSNAALKTNFYDEWIRNNRQKVDTLGSNRIAYSHMKNMSGGELERFLLDMVEQENSKEGIILDLRYNTGGNVHDEVLKFLSQRPYLQWQYRGGKRAPQSNFAPSSKPIVLLINEQSLSDAEMTAAGFKALKLGKVIGTETYRWIIFTSGKGLVDGSSYRVPAWGCYTLEGDNLELTGVAPDIFIKNTFMDLIQGNDPQLVRAVQEIMAELDK